MLGKNVPENITHFMNWLQILLENNKYNWINDENKQIHNWSDNYVETIRDAVKRDVAKFPKHNVFTQCFCSTCKYTDEEVNWMQKAYCIKCYKRSKLNVKFRHVIKNKIMYCECGSQMTVLKSFPWFQPEIYLKRYSNLIMPQHHNFKCNCITCKLHKDVKLHVIDYCDSCFEENGGINIKL